MSTTSYSIYALRTDSGQDELWKPRLFDSLKGGVARFGWSWNPEQDLRLIQRTLEKEGWGALQQDQRESWKAGFLLNVQEGDYLVYINLPNWGECPIARVGGSYAWKEDADWEDFKHCIPVDRDSVAYFNRNDEAVHPALSARLKLQGRWWSIYTKNEFDDLLRSIDAGQLGRRRTIQGQGRRLDQEVRPPLQKIATCIQHCYPGKDLESPIADALGQVPGITHVEHRKGRADHGADLLVEYESGMPLGGLGEPSRCAVQVKSYEGEMGYRKAIDDIRRAFEYHPGCDSGLIVSTALSMSEAFGQALEDLREETGLPVGVLLGDDLARFFLRYSS